MTRHILNLQILGQWAPDKPRQSLKGVAKENEETAKEAVASRNSLTGLLMSRSENANAAPKDPVPASPLPDIDSDEMGNPLAASAYVGDIFAYYRRVEPIFRTSSDYMKDQVSFRELLPRHFSQRLHLCFSEDKLQLRSFLRP